MKRELWIGLLMFGFGASAVAGPRQPSALELDARIDAVESLGDMAALIKSCGVSDKRIKEFQQVVRTTNRLLHPELDSKKLDAAMAKSFSRSMERYAAERVERDVCYSVTYATGGFMQVSGFIAAGIERDLKHLPYKIFSDRKVFTVVAQLYDGATPGIAGCIGDVEKQKSLFSELDQRIVATANNLTAEGSGSWSIKSGLISSLYIDLRPMQPKLEEAQCPDALLMSGAMTELAGRLNYSEASERGQWVIRKLTGGR